MRATASSLPRRPGYYLPPDVAAPPSPPERPQPICGLKAIAEELGIEEKMLHRLVYPDRRRPRQEDTDRPPIWSEPGIGVMSDRAALRAWWQRRIERSALGHHAR